ncbi:MAG: hypothetical protein AAF571_07045 [Verrucomicrobiota bacterium]
MAVVQIGNRTFDGDLSQPRQAKPMQPEYPFLGEGDTQTVILRRTMHQLKSRYRPLPLSTLDTEFKQAYLVLEEGHENIGGGVLEWTRVYSAIPQPRTTTQVIVWDRPGWTVQAVQASPKNITGYAPIGGGIWVFTTSEDHLLSVEDQPRMVLNVGRIGLGGGFQWRFDDTVKVTQVDGATQFRALPKAPLFSSTFFQSGTVYSGGAAGFNRAPKSISIPATIRIDYFLPGVSPGISGAADIQLGSQWTALLPDGTTETNVLGENSIPSIEEYRAMMGNNTLLQAEAATVDRWMGNIYERRTIYVPAS